MTLHAADLEMVDYAPCRYGKTRLMFRGPPCDLQQGYVAILGGTESYGKFVPHPFAAQLGLRLVLGVANLSSVNAGLDLYLNEPDLLAIAGGARAVILQVMAVHNLSNRYYAVHPRRNDRFLRARSRLVDLYPEVDFTEFHFTRHMLSQLHHVSQERFAMIAAELRKTWLLRMQAVLALLPAPVILLQIEGQTDRVMVDEDMLGQIKARVTDHIHVVIPCDDRARSGMIFGPQDKAAAALLPGPDMHDRIVVALAEKLSFLV